MDWGKVRFFLGEVGTNFTRNIGMQLTAIGTVAVTIVILGLFLYARQTLSLLGANVLGQIEISVYLGDKVTKTEVDAIGAGLARDPRILRAAYVPKSEGLRELRQRMQGQIDTSLLTENPLPDAYRVRVRAPDDVPAVAKALRAYPGVASVNYREDVVQRLLRLTQVIDRLGLAIVALLLVVAAVIISNTIRLTVFARRRELSIMQLVGATNAYIQGPLVFEGLLDGVVGTFVAVVALAVARYEFLPKLVVAIPFVPFSPQAVDQTALVFQLLVTGAAIGALASWISVGRYLRT